jgi:hypothetical protein
MDKLYRKARDNKEKIKQRSIVYSMLANAELQIKN